MYRFLRDKFAAVHASFHRSEVLVWARLQILAGALWVAVSGTDLSPLIQNPKVLSGWLIFNGFVTEYLRRRRATDFHEDHKDA